MAFIVVKYGADKERLFNPNCLSAVLLDHVKKTCGYESLTEQVDLASEHGDIVDLINKPKEYAKDYVENRGTYILLKVTTDENDDTNPVYAPLLETTNIEKFKLASNAPKHRKKNQPVADRSEKAAALKEQREKDRAAAAAAAIAEQPKDPDLDNELNTQPLKKGALTDKKKMTDSNMMLAKDDKKEVTDKKKPFKKK